MLWDWNFFYSEVVPRLLTVLPVTIFATMLGFASALTLGLVLAIGRISKSLLVSTLVGELTEFVRGTPLLVQLYFLYFILPEVGIRLPSFETGVAALGVHYASYLSEVFRSGLENVPRGQWEASRALNLSTFKTFRDVIIPQAIPPIVPALGNYLILMFKETPILALVTVNEIMQEAKLIGSESFRYTESFTFAGILFLTLSIGSAVLIRAIERRLNMRWGRR